jgi:hypothetical protein
MERRRLVSRHRYGDVIKSAALFLALPAARTLIYAHEISPVVQLLSFDYLAPNQHGDVVCFCCLNAPINHPAMADCIDAPAALIALQTNEIDNQWLHPNLYTQQRFI